MPELDAEHRNQMAEAVTAHSFREIDPVCSCGYQWAVEEWSRTIDGSEIGWTAKIAPARRAAHTAHVADALAHLVAGWLADAWDDALRDAAADVYEISGHSGGVPVWRAQVADWLLDRADRGGDDG